MNERRYYYNRYRSPISKVSDTNIYIIGFIIAIIYVLVSSLSLF